MNLNKYDYDVLRFLNGEIELELGAWVFACIEHLQGVGYCTSTMPYKITQAGAEFLRQQPAHAAAKGE